MDDTQQQGKGIELFIVQRPAGHYSKICNSPAMKAHFKDKFGIASVKPACETLCLSADDLAAKFCGGENGITGCRYHHCRQYRRQQDRG